MIERLKNASWIKVSVVLAMSLMLFFFLANFATAKAQEGDQSLDVTVQTDNESTPTEQLAWIREQTVAVRQVFNRVKGMLDQARKEKDTLKITCLDDKFTQIHVSLRGIEERTKSLEISTKSGDRTTSNQNFSILKIYISRIFGLNSEAENCLGESDVVLGKTENSTTIAGDTAIFIDQVVVIPDLGANASDTPLQPPSEDEVTGGDVVEQVSDYY